MGGGSRLQRRWRRVALAVVGAVGVMVAPPSWGAVPSLDQVFPIAVPSGSQQLVTAVGKFDPWPPKMWSEVPGLVFEATTNVGSFNLTIATNTPLGPHWVRAYNEAGASTPHLVIVTAEPQLAELEPNDDFTKPQILTGFPVSLNGRLEKSGDVDSFAVDLSAGQTLFASVDAYRLMSPVDAVLRLVDAQGVQVAWNHDDGRTLDPELTWTALTAGRYVLQVFGFAYPADSDIRFTGNARCVYRLHVTTGPCWHYTLPLGVQRGGHTSLEVHGWNLGSRSNLVVEFDGTSVGAGLSQVDFQPAGFPFPRPLPVGEAVEQLEREPNDDPRAPQTITLPAAISGDLNRAGDEDRFAFAAKKGELLLVEVQAASLGFPLDAWLKIENAEGKELARSEGGNGSDPHLEWSASDDGTYQATVGNLLHRGGPLHYYRLTIIRPPPGVRVRFAENAVTMSPNQTNELKVTVTRQFGFKESLSLRAQGLPPGVTAEPAAVSEAGGESSLRLVSATNAPPFGGPIEILATETVSGRVHRAVMDLVAQGENNGVPQGFKHLVLESIDTIWLTVTAPAKSEEKK